MKGDKPMNEKPDLIKTPVVKTSFACKHAAREEGGETEKEKRKRKGKGK